MELTSFEVDWTSFQSWILLQVVLFDVSSVHGPIYLNECHSQR